MQLKSGTISIGDVNPSYIEWFLSKMLSWAELFDFKMQRSELSFMLIMGLSTREDDQF